MFNADEYLDAMSPPSIKINGQTLTGKLMSQAEFLRNRKNFDAWATGRALAEGLEPETFYRDILGKMGFDEAAQNLILALPPAACEAALIDFFVCHRQQKTTTAAQA